jgi:hypothetical protein
LACVSDGFFGSASIGALAVACSDPNLIYAGTGETEIRLDVSYGDGVYKSTDAGGTWSHLCLRETRFVGRICVHPHDPDLVYVVALGDAFGAKEERGVFLSRDGGKTWSKVLYRDANTGAVDLAMDPGNPHPVCGLLADPPELLEHLERRAGKRLLPFHRRRRELDRGFA